MQANFTIPIPPRPHFPQSCTPIIEAVSQHVEAILSSLFESLQQPKIPAFGPNASLPEVRAYFEALDKQLRAAFLRTAVFQECLRRAKATYNELDTLQMEKWGEFRRNEVQSKRGTWLPLEIVSSICALDMSEGRTGLPRDLQECLARWGDLVYNIRKIEILSSEVSLEGVTKARRLVLEVDDTESISAACAITDRWTGLTALQSLVFHGDSLYRPQLLSEILRKAKPVLHHLKELCIAHELEDCGLDCEDTTGTDGVHACSACPTMDVGTKFRVAEAPLLFLPYLGSYFTSLEHLTIGLPYFQQTSDDPGFGFYFHHVSLGRLQSLKIFEGFIGPNSEFLSRGPLLDTPALKYLIILSEQLQQSTVTTILEKFDCPNLETAILSDLFVGPVLEDDPWMEGFLWVESEVGKACGIDEIIEAFDGSCRLLKRLSLYVRPKLMKAEDAWGHEKPQHLVDDFLSELYRSLSWGRETPIKLPMLEYLSIPIGSGCDELTEFLSVRAQLGHPLNTLEVTREPSIYGYKLKYLGLNVTNVISSHMDYYQLSCRTRFFS